MEVKAHRSKPDREVDLTELKRARLAGSRKTHSSPRVLGWAGLFGVSVALAWHFLHLLAEPYRFDLTDPHLWFHLGLETAVALYATMLFLIAWRLLRIRKSLS